MSSFDFTTTLHFMSGKWEYLRNVCYKYAEGCTAKIYTYMHTYYYRTSDGACTTRTQEKTKKTKRQRFVKHSWSNKRVQKKHKSFSYTQVSIKAIFNLSLFFLCIVALKGKKRFSLFVLAQFQQKYVLLIIFQNLHYKHARPYIEGIKNNAS